jgi:hypothetical protein
MNAADQASGYGEHRLDAYATCDGAGGAQYDQ